MAVAISKLKCTINIKEAISVKEGSTQSFTIKANPGYFISTISVDGSPISFNNQLEYTYTFPNVTSNHTTEAQFMKQQDLTPPTLTLPTINGIDLNTPNGLLQVNTPTLTFTVSATDESGIARLVVKVNKWIKLWIGKPIAKVNGVNTPIDSTNSKVVPEIINGRTYLPLRFISENLGASVDWDAKTQTITIYYFK